MCCDETSQPHVNPAKYNLTNQTVQQWYNDAPLQHVRERIKANEPLVECQRCYSRESHGYESKRVKENLKTVIFTEQSFDRSYQQSTYYKDFQDNITVRQPRDWHVDLGNECNLACKMCEPRASSLISSMYQKWKLIPETANRNWTHDTTAWNNFLLSLTSVPTLNRLHFMGGEPLLNKRFAELLDFLIDNSLQSTSVSFVTNGTFINHAIFEKLKQFRSFDIEVSIESIGPTNHYIRQGANTDQIISNIEWMASQQSDQFQLVLRSVPQLLNINNYDQYIRWAWHQRLVIQGNPLIKPEYLQIAVLPLALRQTFIPQYQSLQAELQLHNHNRATLNTGRNVKNIEIQLIRECESMIQMLQAPEPNDVQDLRRQLSHWLMRWDQEFELNATDYYPEYREFLNDIQYKI
jgi:pyruvate-formate lyase-activating enzyme/predicted amino acid-binding ACT domain protein